MTAGDSANQIHGILLLLDVVGPDAEDVAAAIDIHVVVDSADVSCECLLVVGFELFLDLHCMLVLVRHLLDHLGLLDLLLVLLPLQVLPLMLLISQEGRQLAFFLRESGLGPVAERPRLVVLDPVLDGGAEEPPASFELFERLEPRVEASRLRGVNEAGDEVGDDLVALSEQLRLQVMLRAVVDLNFSVQNHYLVLMRSLPSLQLCDVFMVDISAGSEMSTLPVVEGVVRDQAINTDD